jgi:hypothetical protein
MYLFLTNHRQDVLTSSRKITARKRSPGLVGDPPSKSFQQYRPKTDVGPLACQQQHLDSEQFRSAPRTG